MDQQGGRLQSGQLNTMGLFDFLDGVPDDYEPKQRMSAEETEATFVYLKNHPLFMQEIPEDIENYPDLVALQHLTYDDTPENIAKSCNTKANEIIQTKGNHKYFLKKAIDIYSDGIDQNCNDLELQAKLFCNRALVKQKMKNYKAAIQDCKWSIENNPQYIKPYYRAAQCLYQILYFSDAIKMCDAGLNLDSKNKEIIMLKNKCIEELKKLDQKNEIEKKQQEARKVCVAKGIYLKPSQVSLPMEYQPQSLSLIGSNTITTPIIISYPEFQQRDFIQYAQEDDVLSEILQPLFLHPLPWDVKNEYNLNTIAFYIELEDGSYAQINVSAHIIEIMRGFNVVLPMLIELVCVCKQQQNDYFRDQFRTHYRILE